MNLKKKVLFILSLLLAAILLWINFKYSLITLPVNNMVEYQFNLFTINSVLAGFIFTTLGILLGMCSEPFMERVKDTEIVTNKCKKLAISIIFFCISCFISLYFILRCDIVLTRISMKLFNRRFNIINQSLFFLENLCLFVGLIYFVISICGVYDLIKRVYGFKSKNYKKIKNNFTEDLKEARQRQCESEKEQEIYDEF